jgi:carbonic anhydrase/acetyltransferase-like protein (isoleucine patch superfamily)
MKVLGLIAATVVAVLALASPAAARDLRCNGVFKGKTYDDVTVPRGAACTLTNATVRGDVRVLRGAYLQTRGTTVRGDVEGSSAQTIFIDSGSNVRGSVEAVKATQFYVYNSTIGEDIEPEQIEEAVQICGNTVRTGNIEVRRSGTDVLIGDPQAEGCRGNVVKRGDVKVMRNFSLIEFVLRGNTIRRGDLEVTQNTGPTPKLVQDNTGGGRIVCRGNTLLTASGNKGWDRGVGQCAAPAATATG